VRNKPNLGLKGHRDIGHGRVTNARDRGMAARITHRVHSATRVTRVDDEGLMGKAVKSS